MFILPDCDDAAPLVKLTSSRIWVIASQPARLTAGVMNLVQMSRSLRACLFIGWGDLAPGTWNRKCLVAVKQSPSGHKILGRFIGGRFRPLSSGPALHCASEHLRSWKPS
jgi:hypothetical protein